MRRAQAVSEEELSERGSVVKSMVSPVTRVLRASDLAFLKEKAQEYNAKLLQAGGMWGDSDGYDVLAAQIFFAVTLPALFGLLGGIRLLGGLGMLCLLLLAVLGYLYPGAKLKGKARDRQALFFRQFPNALDVLTICVEAGLDFRSAISYLTRVFVPGPVSEEMKLFQRHLRLGKHAASGLTEMASRIQIPEVSGVLSNMVQSIEMGSSMGRILRESAAEMRKKRALAAEEQAKKAVVKMTFPMVVLILPCVFIVLLGPVIMDLVSTF
ncbi:MAG: type II secretion system F family protein [Candidatus Pacebacteria bacterium]|nr:type II secretion system F family protein [Candidatus Paceibacterota bacterium]